MANTHESIELQTWIPRFFADYLACRTSPLPIKPELKSKFEIDLDKLTQWFADMVQPMVDARRGAFHFDPWEVAGLGRDEVRNSVVLAWLLNPKGSHGLGDVAMLGLLGNLKDFNPIFPDTCGGSCRVRVESNPDGDIGNRIDIEIDDEKFYVIIEVKIDAPEGKKQMERYADVSQQLADTRPWALVFLTPQGGDSNTAGPHAGRVLPLSWNQLSFSIAQAVKTRSVSRSNISGPARNMAEQAVQRFLKKMRNF